MHAPDIESIQAPILAIIGTLIRTPANVVTYRGRQYRDYSGVVSHGASCRAMVDVELARRISGEMDLVDSDANAREAVYRAD